MSWPYIDPVDAALARRVWEGKEFKKFAVDVRAGPERRPTYSKTFYAHCRDCERAIAAVKRDAFGIPKRARFCARLAGPKELGCTPMTTD